MESNTKSIILFLISRLWRLKITRTTILIHEVAIISGWSLNFSIGLQISQLWCLQKSVFYFQANPACWSPLENMPTLSHSQSSLSPLLSAFHTCSPWVHFNYTPHSPFPSMWPFLWALYNNFCTSLQPPFNIP